MKSFFVVDNFRYWWMFCSCVRLPSTPAVLEHTWRSHLHRWAAVFFNPWHINHINELLFVAYAEPAAPPLPASSIVASVMSVLGGVALIVLFLACYQRCVKNKIFTSSCCLSEYMYKTCTFSQIYPSESRAGEGRMLSEKKLKWIQGETGLENVQIWPQLVCVHMFNIPVS